MIGFLQKKAELMRNTDPNRIYIENVRSFFHLPYSSAKFLCEMAVKDGYFNKKIALMCPNPNCKRVIQSVDKINTNETIKCFQCEINEEENCEFTMNEIKQVEFYQLKK